MSKNVVNPKRVSFEDALRNLASRLTGRPTADLPRTQEAIVQYMAENVPTSSAGGINVDELVEAITQEVMARLKLNELGEAVTREALARMMESRGANATVTEPAQEPQDGAEGAEGTSTPPAAETLQEAPQTPQSPLPRPGGGCKPKAKAETEQKG